MQGHKQGLFVWFEMMSVETSTARSFYEELFGWKTEAVDMGTFEYTILTHQGRRFGGLLASKDPSHWVPYISAEDVTGAAKAAGDAGALEVGETQDIPDVGIMARVVDAGGVPTMLFRSAQGDVDHEAQEGDIMWPERVTAHAEDVLTMWTASVGYNRGEMQREGADPYDLLSLGERGIAGVTSGDMELWVPYVRVADCEASTQRASALGGQVTRPATEMPGVGVVAIVTDPTGGTIGLVTPG